MGLLVAGVAMAGSAFTNANTSKKASTYYINGEQTISGQEYYTFDQEPADCDGPSLPCQITTVPSSGPGSTLTSPVLKSTVNNASLVTIDSRQSSY